jgi:hypothetical protein
LSYQNTTDNIKYFKKNDYAQPWAGVTFFKSDVNIITSTTYKITVSVISPKNARIMLKIENKNNGGTIQEISQNISTINTLTPLTFNFNGTTANTYNMMTIFFDFLSVADNSVYGLGNYSFS